MNEKERRELTENLITGAIEAGLVGSKYGKLAVALMPIIREVLGIIMSKLSAVEWIKLSVLWARGAKVFREWRETEAEREGPTPKTPEEITPGRPSDANDVAALQWTKSGDPHEILPCYGHLDFSRIALLPIDFDCDADEGGVWCTRPDSDDNGMRPYGEDHMEKRRAVGCFFQGSTLIGTEDWSGQSFPDGRVKEYFDRGAAHVMVIHCQHGRMVSRTILTGV